jgi:ABC-type phosphate transport system substrate-binding protein
MRFSPFSSILYFDEKSMQPPKRPIMAHLNRIRWIVFGLALSLAMTRAGKADVVVVVSSKCAVSTLSKDQVTDIFLGKTTRFPDGAPAVPIDQVEGSPARNEFYETFASKSPAQIKAYWTKIIFTGRGQPPKSISNSVEVRKLIAANPQAISYIERSAVDDSVKVLVQP